MEKGSSRKGRACARECDVSVQLPDGRILTPDEFIAKLKEEKKAARAEELCEQMDMHLAVQLAKERNKLVTLDPSEFD